MDPRTVELLRALQGQEHDAAALERITVLFKEEREALKAVDDLGMLSHLGELLESWAEGAEPELGAPALVLAARSAEDDLEQPARAIKLLESVLDLEPTAEALEQLADLYMKRGGTNDAQQAADLYAALGDTLGGQEGTPYLMRAIALVPAHEASIELSRLYAAEGKYRDALVCISPLAERGNADAVRMHEAYLANLEGAVPARKSKRGESLPPPQVQRPARSGGTMVGFRLDQYHEALKQERQEIAAANAGEPKPDASESGIDGSEDSVVRAMPQKPEAELSKPAPAPAAPSVDPIKTMLGVGKPVLSSKPTAPAARPAGDPSTKLGIGLPPGKLDAGKTMMGIGIPASLAKSVAAAAAPFANPSQASAQAAPVAAAPVAAAAPVSAAPATKVDASKTMMGIGIPAGLLAGVGASPAVPAPAAPVQAATPAEASEPVVPVVRKSLPPPNPEVVRQASSRPPPRTSRATNGRSSAVPSLAASAAAPRPLQVAATELALPQATASEPVAEQQQFAEQQPAEQAAAFVPTPSTPPAIEPFAISSTPRFDSFAPPKKSGLPMKWIGAGVAAVVLIGGAFAMMGGDDKPTTTTTAATSEAGSRVSQQLAATGAAAVPTPPPAPVVAPAAPSGVAPTTAPAATAAVVAPVAPIAEPTPAPAPVAKVASKPKGKVKITPKEIKVKGGKISGTQIMVALEDALPKIERCYHEALEDKPKLSGKLTLGFSIQKTGKLAGAKVTKSTLKNKSLESCAVDAIEGQRFPKVKKVANVTMPIGLTP